MPARKRNNIVENAVSFAADKHKNIYRHDKVTLYISHLVGVALILQRNGFGDQVVAGGLLHDTLEDTDTTPEEIEKVFGSEVRKMVEDVSHNDKLPWREKKLKYIEGVKNGSYEAKAIALADKIHNMNNILHDLERDAEKTWNSFGSSRQDKLWFEEEVLKMYRENWDHPMIEEYAELIQELKAGYF